MSISVVIAAYNAEQYIAETLHSVLAQTTRPDEVIVVDDGSTDRTAEIAERFGAPVRVFRQPNRRQGAARNFGVEQATGDLIAFIDSDDLWDPEKLALQLEQLNSHPGADLCYTGHVRFRRVEDEDHFEPPCAPPPPETPYRDILMRKHFLPSSVLMRRAAFGRLGGFALHFKICEDTDFFLRLRKSGAQFVCLPEPLLKYRVHSSNVSSNQIVQLFERKSIFDQHVLPSLRGIERLTVGRRFHSFTEGEVAYARRAVGDPTYLGAMAKCIALWPFGEPIRYKVFFHMLLTRLGILRLKDASEAQ